MGHGREPCAREKGPTMHQDLERVLPEILRLGRGPALLGELAQMTVDQLAATYRELYGEPTRSCNKGYLRKRLAWRIQELTQGGLSPKALERIRQLGDELPERWRMRAGLPTPPSEPAVVVTAPQALVPRDPRIPPVGSVLRRAFGGKQHDVTVLADGFEYSGERFKTLSAVALRITGTRWNGFLFFALTKRRSSREEAAE